MLRLMLFVVFLDAAAAAFAADYLLPADADVTPRCTADAYCRRRHATLPRRLFSSSPLMPAMPSSSITLPFRFFIDYFAADMLIADAIAVYAARRLP